MASYLGKTVPESFVRFKTAYFLVFVLSNAVLAYSSLGLLAKLWVGLSGIALPLGVALATAPAPSPREVPPQRGDPFAPPAWAWVLLGAAVLSSRLWNLTGSWAWPTGDEGLTAVAGIGLSEKWNWHFFYTTGQAPPLLFWLCGLLFKVSDDTSFNLWFSPALFSVLTVVMGTLAARQFFSAWFSFLLGCLMALGFWPVFIGQHGLPGATLPLWECSCFYLLGKFLKAPEGTRKKWSLALGFCVGLGSLTYTSWPVVAILIGGAVVGEGIARSPKNFVPFLCFLAAFLLTLSPFWKAALTEGYGGYLGSLLTWNYWLRWPHELGTLVDYAAVYFWGDWTGGALVRPVWGGLLNPLLGALFFLGVVELFRWRKLKWVRWAAFGLLFFQLPGLVTLNVNTMRVVQAMPLLLLVAAVGLQFLLEGLPPAKKIFQLSLLLAVSGGLDAWHLELPHRNVKMDPGFLGRVGGSPGLFRSYVFLKDLAVQEGPGFIFTEFYPSRDESLAAMTYPFNAAWNPGLASGEARWAAVLTQEGYLPFLARRFPASKWWTAGDGRLAAGWGILLIPVNPETSPSLGRWVKARPVFRKLTDAVALMGDTSLGEVLDKRLARDMPLLEGDPFLESCFWERMGEVYYHFGNRYRDHLEAVHLAIEKGYPAGHLYHQLAGLLEVAGRTKEAEAAVQKAKESENFHPLEKGTEAWNPSSKPAK